jgi:hypothetical protein
MCIQVVRVSFVEIIKKLDLRENENSMRIE